MQIAVLGAGTMGHGITQVSAMAGHSVRMRDIESSIVDSGLQEIENNLEEGINRDKLTPAEKERTLDRITGTTDLQEAVSDADLVIEAVPEDLDLKKGIFEDVESHVETDTIIATNTSSLPVTDIASVLSTPHRAIGLHFFNPVHIMELVEIVIAEQTGDETVQFANDFIEDINKTGIEITDTPGFASSRLGVAMGVEAMRMVQEGVGTPQDIDTAMELGYNHPMGPLELGDIVGLDVRLDILTHLREELGERFNPPHILKRKVQAGKYGRKSGEGFYIWEDGDIVGMSGDYND
ncbi:MAG: 3-hydroxyacyl-CoA dehydrogenase family protein [Halobacteriaceae archaeon]